MAFRPLVFQSTEDLWVVTHQPGQEIVQARRVDGNLSFYGCGWNVLLVLGIVTREEAQAGVNEIVSAHSRTGDVSSHPGLMISDHTNPKGISGIISERRGIPNLGINRFHFDELGRNPVAIRKEIIDRYFPKNITFGEKYCYVIIKYIRNWETGSGHTVLLAFNKLEEGWEASIIDPQMKRINGFEETVPYLLTTDFIGIACCGVMTAGGKSRKTKRKSRKSLKRKLQGGESTDPEMYPMTIEQEKEYQSMIQDLKRQPYSKPSVYYPSKSSAKPFVISL